MMKKSLNRRLSYHQVTLKMILRSLNLLEKGSLSKALNRKRFQTNLYHATTTLGLMKIALGVAKQRIRIILRPVHQPVFRLVFKLLRPIGRSSMKC